MTKKEIKIYEAAIDIIQEIFLDGHLKPEEVSKYLKKFRSSL